MDGRSHQIVQELGPHIDERITPCSTFKIALSLIGFDAGILENEKNPMWLFQEGYDDFLDVWKGPQTPLSWMKTSCIWYSRLLTDTLGLDRLQLYLTALNYGNLDLSGGLTNAWLSSSLTISPREQVQFLTKLITENLPISAHAIQITKNLLLIEELPGSWKLFGKTGAGKVSNLDEQLELGWFVGWVEKEDRFFPFAYTIRSTKIDPSQRIPKVKQILELSKVLALP